MTETGAIFLGEIKPLYDGLLNSRILVGTIDEQFLTFEGLLRAMDASNPPVFQVDQEANLKCFETFCVRGLVPLMCRNENGRGTMVIGIATHNTEGILRDHNEVYYSLTDALGMSLNMGADNEYLKFVFLTHDQAKEIVGKSLVFSAKERTRYLKGIDADSTAKDSFVAMMKFAASERATDIHIEPGPQPRIRYRIDGIMQTGDYDLTVENVRKLVAVIKQRANLKIDEHAIPQDGGISFTAEDLLENALLKNCSLRVSLLPTIHDPREYGEKVVLRLLRANPADYDLDKLKIAPDILGRIRRRILEPKGLILVTGPTGSGKTTTMYAMLEAINDGTKNITTVEDPVEVPLIGITQTPINQRIGMTFASILRALLRQDPDVIMVGEIRDKETADVSFDATNTGHLVLATLHTDDCISTLLRIMRLGISGENIAPNLKAVLSQRLARSICSDCMTNYDASDELKYLLGGDYIGQSIENYVRTPINLYQAVSGNKLCRHCGGAGYRGRFLLMEYWGMGDGERQLILSGNEDREEYVKAAMAHGFRPMAHMAISALLSGYTDIAELKRAAVTEEEFLRQGKQIARIFDWNISAKAKQKK